MTFRKTSGEASRRAVALTLGGGFALAGAAMLALTADSAPELSRKIFGLWRARIFLPASLAFIVALGCFLYALSKNSLLAYSSSVFGVFFGFCLLEVVGQVGIVNWQSVFAPRINAMGWEATPQVRIDGVTYQDLASSWGLSSEPITFSYHTDSFGFRNTVDRDSAAVYVLGDSMVVGALTPTDRLVSSLLEHRLRVPVMQVALIGKGPQEVQELFAQAGLPAQGRLVIQFVFEGNDLLDSRRTRLAQAPEAAGGPATLKDRSFGLQVLLSLQKLTQPVAGEARLQSCTIDEQLFLFGWTRSSFEGLEEEAGAIAESLESFSDRIEQEGGRFIVVFVPSKLRVLGHMCRFPAESSISDLSGNLSFLRDYLAHWSRESGIPLLDLTDPLVASAETLPWLWGDTHWNETGHQIAADAVARWIIDHGWLPR